MRNLSVFDDNIPFFIYGWFNHENISIRMKYLITGLPYMNDFSLETLKLDKILIK